MTYTHRTEDVGKYHISIRQEKFADSYEVILSESFDDVRAIVVKQNVYATMEQARRRYNQLRFLVKRGDL